MRPDSLLLLGLLALAACASNPSLEERAPNVLFIAVDDLRPELSILGGRARTPNMDALAAEGLLFRNHMAVVPTCGASRRAMLTGRFPRRTELNNDACLKLARPGHEAPTWPGLLRAAGWHTVCLGKISHSPDGRVWPEQVKSAQGELEVPGAWDEAGFDPGPWEDAWAAFFAYEGGATRKRGQSPTTERGADSTRYPDALLADQACARLPELAAADEPFLLAVGFFKPHLPFTARTSDWDGVAGRAEGIVHRPLPPEGTPAWATHGSGELLGNYGSHPDGRRVDDAYARQLQEGYLACVEATDREVGRVLRSARALQDDRDLLVVLWSDHGWHLGDRGVWGKHTLFDEALRCPLVVAGTALGGVPRLVEEPVSTLDVAPTILEVCGAPAMDGALDGQSLVPFASGPSHRGRGSAPSAWRAGGYRGTTVRTSEGRLTRWTRGDEEPLLERARVCELPGCACEPGDADLESALTPLLREPLR